MLTPGVEDTGTVLLAHVCVARAGEVRPVIRWMMRSGGVSQTAVVTAPGTWIVVSVSVSPGSWVSLVAPSCVTWSVVIMVTVLEDTACVTRAGREAAVRCRPVMPGVLNMGCAAMALVSAPMVGMVNTALWRGVLATAMVMGHAPCQTTSRAGSVCVRVAGTDLAATSDWSKDVTTRLTMTKVRNMIRVRSSSIIIIVQMVWWTVRILSVASLQPVNIVNSVTLSQLPLTFSCGNNLQQ